MTLGERIQRLAKITLMAQHYEKNQEYLRAMREYRAGAQESISVADECTRATQRMSRRAVESVSAKKESTL